MVLLGAMLLGTAAADPVARLAERLGRGAVAVPSGSGHLITWRALGDDPPGLRFVVERDGKRLTPEPIALTQYLDAEAGPAPSYRVTPITATPSPAATVRVQSQPFLHVPLQRPADWTAPDGSHVPYEANDGAPADLDGDGRLLYSTGLGHGDALHVGRLDPTRPGLQVFMVHESPQAYGEHGVEMHDAATGRLLWSSSGEGRDVGRGVCMDIDAAHPGQECWASVGPLLSARGAVIADQKPRAVNFGLWWDGDLLRETLDRTQVAKWNPQAKQLDILLDAAADGATSNNGTKATPVFSADLFGDWREEVVWRTAANDALLVYTTPHPTTHPTTHRLVILMHDLQYRVQVAAQNAGDNQPPQPLFFLGAGMVPPPTPALVLL